MRNNKVLTANLRRLLCLVVTIMLSACAAVAPLPQDSYYRLKFDEGTAAKLVEQPWSDEAIYVARIQAEGLYRERALTYMSAGSPRVQQHRYHLWFERPAQMLRYGLIGRFAGGRSSASCRGFPTDSHALEVHGRLVRMDQIVDGENLQVRVVLSFAVRDPNRVPTVILTRDYRESRDVTDARAMDGTVRAIAAAVNTIFDRFITDTDRILAH